MSSASANPLRERRYEIARAAAGRMLDLYPILVEQYGYEGIRRFIDDGAALVSQLAQAIAIDLPRLFEDYVAWARTTWIAARIAETHFVAGLQAIASVLTDFVPARQAVAGAEYIERVLHECSALPAPPASYIDETQPPGRLARALVDALVAFKRDEAMTLIEAAVGAGMAVPDLYVEVFQPALYEIGLLWQTGRISVAVEHHSAVVIQSLINRLEASLPPPNPRARVALAGIPGELHDIGLRMVAHLLRAAGWNAILLGANVPAFAVVECLEQTKARILCLSMSTAWHLDEAVSVIAAVRRTFAHRPVRIVIGGGIVHRVPEIWSRIGADAYAPDARTAVDVCTSLAVSE